MGLGMASPLDGLGIQRSLGPSPEDVHGGRPPQGRQDSHDRPAGSVIGESPRGHSPTRPFGGTYRRSSGKIWVLGGRSSALICRKDRFLILFWLRDPTNQVIESAQEV